MAKKKKELTFDDILEMIYYFLKEKLSFDDIQAITFIASGILLPLSIFLGFFYTKIEMFQNTFYITMAIDILVAIYSVFKFRYYKTKRINFIEKLESKSIIVVDDIDDVNKLNPYEFELFIKEYFIKKGYKAWTTKKTHDNGADVIAEKNDQRIAIQVKYSSNSIKGYAVYQTLRGKYNYIADKAILVTNSELTSGAKLDAIRDGIEVIDGNSISLFLRKNDSIKVSCKTK